MRLSVPPIRQLRTAIRHTQMHTHPPTHPPPPPHTHMHAHTVISIRLSTRSSAQPRSYAGVVAAHAELQHLVEVAALSQQLAQAPERAAADAAAAHALKAAVAADLQARIDTPRTTMWAGQHPVCLPTLPSQCPAAKLHVVPLWRFVSKTDASPRSSIATAEKPTRDTSYAPTVHSLHFPPHTPPRFLATRLNPAPLLPSLQPASPPAGLGWYSQSPSPPPRLRLPPPP